MLSPGTGNSVKWANSTQIGDSLSPCNNTMLTFQCAGTVSRGVTLYMYPSATQTTCMTTVATAMVPVSFSGTIKNLEVVYITPPGAGPPARTDTFTVLKCTGLDSTMCSSTGVTCNISGAPTVATCSDTTHSASVSQGDGIQVTDATDANSSAATARITVQVQ